MGLGPLKFTKTREVGSRKKKTFGPMDLESEASFVSSPSF